MRKPITNFLIGFAFTVFITKLIFSGTLLVMDSARLIAGAGGWIFQAMGTGMSDNIVELPGQRSMIASVAAGIASVPMFLMLYGITKGKYNYTINTIKLAFKDLPGAFDGFRIVQISDIHAGSFDSVEQVKKGVEMVNAENPDLILFTGDLVNSHKDEIDPYLDTFRELKARYGMYSVTGNHDYYGTYRTNKGRERDLYWKDFYNKHKYMGFDILNDTHRRIEKEGKHITVVGIENWGAGPFPKIGNLENALEDVDPSDFTILMSHDPTHWDHHTLEHEKHIHLTLAGHTHGMQFGIDLPNFKWSPAKYRYEKWAGLFEEAGQYLYVNRGFGFLGFPGRVGVWPEITVIELIKKA